MMCGNSTLDGDVHLEAKTWKNIIAENTEDVIIFIYLFIFKNMYFLIFTFMYSVFGLSFTHGHSWSPVLVCTFSHNHVKNGVRVLLYLVY